MGHLPFTLLAYFFNSISVTLDKFLLSKSVRDPLLFLFYFSLVSCVALFLLPFTHIPSLNVFLLASSATVLWSLGAYFMFKALRVGQVSRAIPIIGTLVPIFLLFFALLQGTISTNQLWAVGFLILGLIVLTSPDWRGRLIKRETSFEIIAALFFASSYAILRQAYLHEQFLTVLVWSRMVLIPLALLILAIKPWRRVVLNPEGEPKINFFSKTGVLFLLSQATGGAQELLLTFSISLADPSLVNSLQGVQYVFLFIFSLILSKPYPHIFKENMSFGGLSAKIVGIIFVGLGLYILAFSNHVNKAQTLGVTYSPRYAQSLGLDPKITYTSMLDELKIKYVRLPIYWDEIEMENNKLDKNYLSDYLNEAQKRGVDVILVVGYKQPRWPECFAPSWVKKLPDDKFQQAILNLVSSEVELFKKYPAIKAWQVENEPTLSHFGDNCRLFGGPLLQKEVNLVKKLDKRSVIVTGSGELDTWIIPMQSGDIFGTTLYRTVYNNILGYTHYPLPPIFYDLKSKIVRQFFAPQNQKTVIIELQEEPWSPQNDLMHTPIFEQTKRFSAKTFKNNIEFAKQTGFDEIYLWGVEWWYFMKNQGHPEYWSLAEDIFK